MARRNAAMDVLPSLVVLLAAPNDELIFLRRDIKLVAGKTRYRQRDAEPFRLTVFALAALVVVGRIAVGAFHDPIERTLDLVESQKERTGQRWNTRHSQSPLEATLAVRALAAPFPAACQPSGYQQYGDLQRPVQDGLTGWKRRGF